MRTRNNNISAMPSHIEDERLLAYLDGEIDAESQIEIQGHLDKCWDCRSRMSAVERSIENFLGLRHRELLPADLPPSGPALDLFRARLSAHQSLTPAHSFFRVHLPDLGGALGRISGALNIAGYSLRTQVFLARATAAVLVVSMVTVFVLMSGQFTTVSASDLLRLSIEAQGQQLAATDKAVLHQRITVVRTGSRSDRVAPVTWEIWNDTVNSRVKLAAYDQNSRPATSPVIADLRYILQANRMNEHRPISAASYKSWTDSLASKTEEVTRGTNSDGIETLTIKTAPSGPVSIGSIVEARLSIRATDYHPMELDLTTNTTDGPQDFELFEQDFQVVSLSDLDPAIFADPAKLEVASTVGNKSAPPVVTGGDLANANTEVNTNTPPPPVNAPAATTAAEVEVLELLNKVGADISEQINVTRTADGRLLVEGLVESDKRKAEILSALSTVSGNPAIKIKIQTIEEATRALTRQKQQANQTGPGTIDRVEVEKGALPVDSELRQYLAAKGGDTDAEIRQFASRVINRSQAALFQASALNRLANRFKAEQLGTLDPAARAKWLNILKGYASAVRRETASLRGELNSVFGGMSGGGESESITSDADLIASARRLYDLAAANDRAVRSAFTLSSGSSSASAVKSAQFRANLGIAEKLAAAIERAR